MGLLAMKASAISLLLLWAVAVFFELRYIYDWLWDVALSLDEFALDESGGGRGPRLNVLMANRYIARVVNA
jgi:hypothetical protein